MTLTVRPQTACNRRFAGDEPTITARQAALHVRHGGSVEVWRVTGVWHPVDRTADEIDQLDGPLRNFRLVDAPTLFGGGS